LEHLLSVVLPKTALKVVPLPASLRVIAWLVWNTPMSVIAGIQSLMAALQQQLLVVP